MKQSLSRWIWLPFLLLLITPWPGQAQVPLPLNTPVNGTLASAGAQQLYAFDGQSGQSVTLDVTSTTAGLLLQMSLFGPDGAIVQQFQNQAQQPSFTAQVALPQTGRYTLLVASSNNNSGNFTLTLSGSSGSRSGSSLACETIIGDVLNSLDQRCAGVGRNQACYGNLLVEAQPDSGATGFVFQQEGDTVNLTDLQAFRLSPMDTANNTWGLVLMRVQANLPDVLPGQNVTMLFFGDTQVINNPVFDPASAGTNAPMQSVYFRRGISAASCGDTPDTGFVIQTPQGVGQVELTVNDVTINLGSTLFAHVVGTDALEFNLTDGTAQIQAAGGTQTLQAGQRVRVPVNSQLLPEAPPQAPEPIDPAVLERFPLEEIPSNDDLNNPPEPVATEDVTPQSETDERPQLPVTGPCVVATFEDVTVNVREQPSVEAPAVSFMQPDDVLNVRGRDQGGEWLQTSRGWVADFVVRKGGDCDSLPVTYIPPTPTPTPSPTPALPIAGSSDQDIKIDYLRDGVQHNLFGELSAPEGNRSDTIQYFITNYRSTHGSDFQPSFSFSFSCDSPNVDDVLVTFSDGRSAICGARVITYRFTDWMDGSVTFSLSEPERPVYATWSMTVSVQDD